MSIKRYAAKRDQNEAVIIAALRQCGATVEQLDQPVDLLVGWQGMTAIAEIKKPKRGKLTPGQKTFLETWQGSPVAILTSADQAVLWLKSLRG